MVPEEASVNITSRGVGPLCGDPVKLAEGGWAVVMVKLAVAIMLSPVPATNATTLISTLFVTVNDPV